MRRLLAAAAAGIWAAGAAPVQAHPHVFIDTGGEVIFDTAGQATALRITWTYDDFISLSILSDHGLDSDMDGRLTEDEKARLNGFDMHWDAGYPGDTYALLGKQPLVLGPPEDWTADVEDGKLISTHLRRIDPPVTPVSDPLIVQSYDPSYYVQYTIPDLPKVTGREGCKTELLEPDLTAADEQLQAALSEYSADMDVEVDYPAVGAAFADEVRVTCADPS